ncbi:hypothetical protein PS662_01699 [Pseudomonas fluorescens]|uniref:Uncharacterized protein n=1 Tax=Pseudomonas fluorescens TaxID=294 RepID=A0A5E6RQJ3_PSEFL|nr:hypothetical protein [Pseudomonas fluorescens]VVM69053.1 hypothetical protein PS662_01699 [Pseudomonas fluorescens]
MNSRLAVFTAPLLLAVALSSSFALASDEKEEPAKPNCPKGHVWDSKSQRCVMQTSRLEPITERIEQIR